MASQKWDDQSKGMGISTFFTNKHSCYRLSQNTELAGCAQPTGGDRTGKGSEMQAHEPFLSDLGERSCLTPDLVWRLNSMPGMNLQAFSRPRHLTFRRPTAAWP